MKLKKILIYIIFFYIIYTPSISSSIIFDKNITIPVITLLFIFYYFIVCKNNEIKINKIKFWFIIFIEISNLYCLGIYLLKNESFNLINSRIIQNNLVVCYLTILAVLFLIMKSMKLKKENILNIVINLAVIQGIISILMVAIPSLHNIALSFYYRGMSENIFISSTRIYGISSDYTYATPIYHGFLAALSFNKYLSTNKKISLLQCLLILISVILNGRTGLIIFILIAGYYLIRHLIRNKDWLKFIKVILIFLLVFISIILFLKTVLPSTYKFLNSFVTDTRNLIVNEQYNGNYEVLKNGLYFPKGKDLIFGKGFRIFGEEGTSRGYVSSDIGFVNDIFMGGIIYTVLLYFAYFYLINKSLKKSSLKIPLILTILIANFKGEAFHSAILIFLILFLCLWEEYHENRINHSNCSYI